MGVRRFPSTGAGRRVWLAGLLVLCLFGAARAQYTGGPITLQLDATQAPLKLLHTTMHMPVKPGPLTLYYPKWIPGEHEPDGPIGNVTGLRFQGNGKPIAWARDPLDMFTFHLTVPGGVHDLEIEFDFIEGSSGEYTSGSSSTPKLVDVNWNQNLLYPAGVAADQIVVQPSLILPPQWKFGTALPVAQQRGNEIQFRPADLVLLVDSPVIAGQFFRVVDITPPGEPIHHEWDIVADAPGDLAVSDSLQQEMTNLVAETGKLFGTRHYRDYHFLLTLSDHVAHFGLEHHECDDSRLPERALLGSDPGHIIGELLPHEFIHSWNGKFRRPAGLASAPYQSPMQTSLLWVYEGLTDYLGNLEATRSGLWTDGQYRQWLASIAAELGPGRPGRTWRPLADTATAVPGMFENGDPHWISWRRDMDYYDAGDLLWLNVSTIIHDRSHGKKSLRDFLQSFYGGPNRGPQLKTYTFDDLVAALQQVEPYDWAGFFHQRLTSLAPEPDTAGITASGWTFALDGQDAAGAGNLLYSVGLLVGPGGEVEDSVWGGASYKAGVIPGMTILGVNGRTYTRQRLDDAVVASTQNKGPIALLVDNDDYLTTCLIDYHGGPKAPRLVRNEAKPDYLRELLQPLAAAMTQ